MKTSSLGRRLPSGHIAHRQPAAPIWAALAFAMAWPLAVGTASGSEPTPGSRFREVVEPILADYCYGCHGGGIKKGNVTLDEFPDDRALLARPELWHDVLKNVRAGLMPPNGKPRPSGDELAALEGWIKQGAFGLDPADPDPGRVTLRRLNRVEYRETIRDLMGIEFRADEEFPADDSGYGFDNIGDVLTISPLLLEKYMQAAEAIVGLAVPSVPRVVASRSIPGSEFKAAEGGVTGERLTLYKAATVSKAFPSAKGGPHKLVVELGIRANFDFDPGRAKVVLRLNDRELLAREFGWEGGKKFRFEYDESLKAGENTLTLDVAPITPVEKRINYVDLRIASVQVEGPFDPSDWVRPPNFERFFDRDDPGTPDARRVFAREVLKRFASRAFRRPVDDRTLERLVAIAEEAYGHPGVSAYKGIGRAMVAVLASPRFLFRFEAPETGRSPRGFARVDEYSLATRLSYFLWSTMPDDELLGLAGRGELRANQDKQVRRMLADPRAEAMVRDFTGQWLQARDFEHFPIQFRILFRREGLPPKMDGEIAELRKAMKQETESYFAHVVREDRPILELIDSDYTFVNEILAKHYEIPGVTGGNFRKVTLPEGSPRGGLLTQAGVLMVTSNPTRTSPVKRGQFILENILGTPTPPPPPDIPSLEDTLKGIQGREPTMREVMEVHRANALCASCHNRMDPLGLAMENFNAIGIFRTTEKKQPIDTSGKLVNGRAFQGVRDLKAILKEEHKLDFYRCLTEKLLTYALGRGIEYHDVEAVDRIVERVDREGGKFSALLMGIVESAPFQKRREGPSAIVANSPEPSRTSTPQGSKP